MFNPHIYRVVLRSQLNPGRILSMAALGGVAILLALLSRMADDTVRVATQILAVYGIQIFAPLFALTLGSAALGDLVEDRTLVYLWLRPVPRRAMSTAAMAAVLTVTLPVVVAVMTVAAVITGVEDLVAATAVSTALAVFAYSGIFLALGARFKRSLLFGLAYIAIWEGLLSNLGNWFARLSVRSYPISILSDATGVDLRLADRSAAASYIVPLAVGLAGLAYTWWSLTRTEID